MAAYQPICFGDLVELNGGGSPKLLVVDLEADAVALHTVIVAWKSDDGSVQETALPAACVRLI
jgi:hypothetical protein